MLQRTANDNQTRYQVDLACPIFEELAGIFRKAAGLVDVLRGALELLAGKIVLAFVFGAVAEGKELTNSDVDVIVVGTASFASVKYKQCNMNKLY